MGGTGGCGSGFQKKWAVMSRNLTWELIPYTMCQSLYKEGGQGSTLSICRGSTGWLSHSGPIAETLRTCVCGGLSVCRPAVCINLLIVPIWSSDQCNPPEVHFSLFCKHTHCSRSVAYICTAVPVRTTGMFKWILLFYLCSFIQSDNKYLETWISFCAVL